MREGLWLWLRAGRCGKCSLGFSGGRGTRKKVDFVSDGAAEVIEGLANVGGIVVGFVGILGAW